MHHAEMAIEGIDEQGSPFLKFLHFTGVERVSDGRRSILRSLGTQSGRVRTHSYHTKIKYQTRAFK